MPRTKRARSWGETEATLVPSKLNSLRLVCFCMRRVKRSSDTARRRNLYFQLHYSN